MSGKKITLKTANFQSHATHIPAIPIPKIYMSQSYTRTSTSSRFTKCQKLADSSKHHHNHRQSNTCHHDNDTRQLRFISLAMVNVYHRGSRYSRAICPMIFVQSVNLFKYGTKVVAIEETIEAKLKATFPEIICDSVTLIKNHVAAVHVLGMVLLFCLHSLSYSQAF